MCQVIGTFLFSFSAQQQTMRLFFLSFDHCVNRAFGKIRIRPRSRLLSPPLEFYSISRVRFSRNGWSWNVPSGTKRASLAPLHLCPQKSWLRLKDWSRSRVVGRMETEQNDVWPIFPITGTWDGLLLWYFYFLPSFLWGCFWMRYWKNLDNSVCPKGTADGSWQI